MFLHFLLKSPSTPRKPKKKIQKTQSRRLKSLFSCPHLKKKKKKRKKKKGWGLISCPRSYSSYQHPKGKSRITASGSCMDNDMQNLVMNRIILKKNIKKPLGLTINFKIGIWIFNFSNLIHQTVKLYQKEVILYVH
jgi:hypothetical protein